MVFHQLLSCTIVVHPVEVKEQDIGRPANPGFSQHSLVCIHTLVVFDLRDTTLFPGVVQGFMFK